MRNILVNILTCCVLALCCPAFASAQAGGYDKALDKYAYICDRCVELRDRAKSGQKIREDSLKSLLEELAALRKTLSGASGRMTAAQAARFEEIKAKYSQGMKSSGENSLKKAEPIPRLASLPVAEPATKPVGEPALAPEKPEALRPIYATSASSIARKRTGSQGLQISTLADVGIFPTPTFGVAAVVTWNGVGAYASYRSNFRKNEYSYVCSSDGSTEYGRIWTTGESRQSRTVATAGFAMFASRRVGFRLGAGLTSYTRCWEDVSGQWAKVSDKSFSGFAADGGIFIAFNPLILSLGVTSDFSGNADLQLGVGFRF